MKLNANFVLALAAVSALAACGGGGGGGAEPVSLVTSDVVVAAAPTTVGAVANLPFSFPAGVPAFGTTAPTTLTFTSATATPSFNVSSGGKTATGGTTFGSCIFEVTESTFEPPSPLAKGQSVRVNPCNVKVAAQGKAANGQGTESSAALELGQAASAGVPVTVQINAGGQVTLNGNSVGTVTLSPVTGS